jgi:hypothetical protein
VPWRRRTPSPTVHTLQLPAVPKHADPGAHSPRQSSASIPQCWKPQKQKAAGGQTVAALQTPSQAGGVACTQGGGAGNASPCVSTSKRSGPAPRRLGVAGPDRSSAALSGRARRRSEKAVDAGCGHSSTTANSSDAS